MNIAFDAKRITHNATGLGNYSRFVVGSLAEFVPEHHYLLYSPDEGKQSLYASLLAHHSVRLVTPSSCLGRACGNVWRNYGILPRLRKDRVDLYHGLSNELPMGLYHSQIPTIVTIHDLAFVRYPEYYKPIDRWLYRSKYGTSARAATHVVAVSEATKRDVVELMGVPEERVSVIYQGCSPCFASILESATKAVREKYHLPERYVLFVGSIEERKNLLLAIRALAQLTDKSIELIAVGKRTPYCDKIVTEARRLGIADRVHLLHGVPFADLGGFYGGAELFVYPSRFEGFGIPIIEALNAGVPTIAARGTCLEEAGGPASLYSDPDDVEEMATLMSRALENVDLRREMIYRGRAYVQRFEPRTIARELKTLYGRVYSQGAR